MNATPMAPWWLTFNQLFSESSGCILQKCMYTHRIHTHPKGFLYVYIYIYILDMCIYILYIYYI